MFKIILYDRVEMGKRIEKRMQALNLKRSDVAAHVGVKSETIRKYIHAEVGMSVENLISIADILKTDINSLLFGMEIVELTKYQKQLLFSIRHAKKELEKIEEDLKILFQNT